MKTSIATVFFLWICGTASGLRGQTVTVQRVVTLMGSRFDITVVEKDSAIAVTRIQQSIDEIARIERLISEWDPQSQISAVNRNAGIGPVTVDREVFELTERAIAYSQMTGGAFDITMAAMLNIWKFDGSMTDMPTANEVKEAIRNTGYRHILLDSTNSTIFLTRPGMKIGFGSIGKGYAADRGRALLKSLEVPGGIVNASGDLSAWGSQRDGKAWKIGITDPFKSNRVAGVISLRESSVATSGSYEKYAEIDGKRYSHIIDPVTGYPATGLISVTILGPSAEMANALSTSIMVMGETRGLKLLQSNPAYNYWIVTDQGKIIRSIRKKQGRK